MVKLSSFNIYSEALKDFISKAYKGTVIYEPSDVAFEYALNGTKNKVSFPMISFYHQPDLTIDTSLNSFPSYKRGRLFENKISVYDDNMKDTGTKNEKISKSVQNLYITMKYILDVWGTDRISTEKAVQELLFWLYDNQQINITYQGVPLNMSFDINPNIVDNTDLVAYHSNGKLYRYSIAISSSIVLFRSVDMFNAINPEVKITVGTN
jgi:hypothetical protein